MNLQKVGNLQSKWCKEKEDNERPLSSRQWTLLTVEVREVLSLANTRSQWEELLPPGHSGRQPDVERD